MSEDTVDTTIDFDYNEAAALLHIVGQVAAVAPALTAISSQAMSELRAMNAKLAEQQAEVNAAVKAKAVEKAAAVRAQAEAEAGEESNRTRLPLDEGEDKLGETKPHIRRTL